MKANEKKIIEGQREYEKLAGKIAPYKELTKECMEFHGIIKKLYPNDYWQLCLEAHHVIEKHFFKKYTKFFKNEMGYNSENDMPAVAIHSIWHRNTPKKKLKQMVNSDLTGLSQHLINAFKEKKDYSPTAMIEIYKNAYDKIEYEGHLIEILPNVWKVVEPILKKLAEFEKS